MIALMLICNVCIYASAHAPVGSAIQWGFFAMGAVALATMCMCVFIRRLKGDDISD